MKKLTDKFFKNYCSAVKVNINKEFEKLSEREWTSKNFTFATAVSVMSSSRIEGESLELDSYVKHKILNVEYLPNLIEKPNDLYEAYEFVRDNPLTAANFLQVHSIATKHLLPASQRGIVRKVNMLVMEQKTNRVQYEAANSFIVKDEYDSFWQELSELIEQDLSIEEVFYFASLVHLVFVNIHPFNDGNGRTARLLEKWFLVSKLGKKAWFIPSENYYYQNLNEYYTNLARLGLYYDDLDYEKALPFLLMLPKSLL